MSSYAEWLAEEEEAALRWAQTTVQPQSLVNVANHFRGVTEMIGKDDHFAKTGKMVGNEDPTGPIDPMAGW